MAKTTATGEKRARRIDGRQVATGVAIVLLLWFAVSNWHHVQINFWVTSARAPLFVVIVLAALLGGFVAWIVRRQKKDSGTD